MPKLDSHGRRFTPEPSEEDKRISVMKGLSVIQMLHKKIVMTLTMCFSICN